MLNLRRSVFRFSARAPDEHVVAMELLPQHLFDVDEFTAIFNPPEAILAVGAVRQLPVVEAGQVVAGWRMKVTLSADHRATDGAEAARWLEPLRTYLEHPLRLFL